MEILIDKKTVFTPRRERLLQAIDNTLRKIELTNHAIESRKEVLEEGENVSESLTIWSHQKMKAQLTNDLIELLRKIDLHFQIEEPRQAA
jgi:hypothetical protein